MIKAYLLAFSPAGSRWEEARLEAELGCQLNPQDAGIISGSAFVLANAGDPLEAIRLCERSLRINPRDPVGYSYACTNLANAHLAARNYAKGIDWALRATSAAPGFAPAHAYMAALYVGAGDIERAKLAFETAHRLAPGAVRTRPKPEPTDPSRPRDRGSESRERYNTFLRIAAGLEDHSAAEALR